MVQNAPTMYLSPFLKIEIKKIYLDRGFTVLIKMVQKQVETRFLGQSLSDLKR